MHVAILTILAGLAALGLLSPTANTASSLPQQLGPYTLRSEISLGEEGCGFEEVHAPDELKGHSYLCVLAGDKVAMIIWRKDDSVEVADFTQDDCFTPVVPVDEPREAPWDASVTPAEVALLFNHFLVPDESWDIPGFGIRKTFQWQDPESGLITVMEFEFKNDVLEAVMLDAPDLREKHSEEYWSEYWKKKTESGNGPLSR